jgi:hypothetical protein
MRAVHSGLEILRHGGGAADAAMATAMTQIVEAAGEYVSFAGILSMVYYDAATKQIHYFQLALVPSSPQCPGDDCARRRCRMLAWLGRPSLSGIQERPAIAPAPKPHVRMFASLARQASLLARHAQGCQVRMIDGPVVFYVDESADLGEQTHALVFWKQPVAGECFQ